MSFKSTDGDCQIYDTLDNAVLREGAGVEEIFLIVAGATRATVGVCIAGMASMSTPNLGYWGRSVTLCTGENFQMRICPRGRIGKPLHQAETRLIATRRTSINSVPVVSCVLLFLPRELTLPDSTLPASNGTTIGCRGVHLMLPSNLRKHNARRDTSTIYPTLDPEGYSVVRPSTMCLSTRQAGRSNNVRLSMTPGTSYIHVAAALCGVDMPDTLARSSSAVTDGEHSKMCMAKHRVMSRAIGDANTASGIASALALVETMSAEGLCGMLTNSFFEGALPDRMHSPSGMPLCLAMAVYLAVHPERFDLSSCTIPDAFVNQELWSRFQARWCSLTSNGSRALDLAMKSGYDNACLTAAESEGTTQSLKDNLSFWQRVGQRMAAKLLSDPSDELLDDDGVCDTLFGRAELVDDTVSAAKYAALASEGFAKPVTESPIDRLFLASKCDSRASLFRMMDGVEHWLRTGFYGNYQLSKPNEAMPGDADSEVDDVLKGHVCVAAVEDAGRVLALSMIHGVYVQTSFDLRSYLVSDACDNTCADCDARVCVLQGVVFASAAGQCKNCNRKRCFKCAAASLGAASTIGHCRHCCDGR